MRSWRVLSLFVVLTRCHTAPADTIGTLPSKPDASASTSHAVTTFAMDALLLGESPLDGAPSYDAWKRFGLNLDGLTTDGDASATCILQNDASTAVQVDGVNGIDNSFGASVIPILVAAFSLPTPSSAVNDAIQHGLWTLEIQTTGLTNDPDQNATGLGAQVFVGARLSGTPLFDAALDWPVAPSSLSDGLTIASGARVHFSTVYVAHGVVVARDSNEPLVLPLQVTFSPTILSLGIRNPTLAFKLTSTGAATDGVIAGELDPNELKASLRLAVDTTSSLCRANEFLDDVAKAQDILANGTNAPGVPCNAISIGLGFTALPIANPTQVGTDPAALVDPCDAGVD